MADNAAAIMVAHGALGCAQQLRRSAGRRRLVRLEAFFTDLSDRRLAALTSTLRRTRMLADDDSASSRQRIADPGWATMWRRHFTPIVIGERILIVPPWSARRDPARARIVIQPAQAFGTGRHPTTRGVLSEIDRATRDGRIRRALDVGAGSGVLAIAMKKLGVAEVVAIDSGPVAIESARDNAALNGFSNQIRFSAVPLGSIRGRFDLIAANIISSVLIGMAPRLKHALRAGGTLILSGILEREARAVAAHYRPLSRLATRVERGWATLVLGW